MLIQEEAALAGLPGAGGEKRGRDGPVDIGGATQRPNLEGDLKMSWTPRGFPLLILAVWQLL